jgi:SNF2 family DNA or RNA helicase
MKFEPHIYQTYAIERMVEQPRMGLFLDMGLGKTVITLSAADRLLNEEFRVDCFLVIAPKRVAEDTWSTEAAKWDHLARLRVARCLGTEKQRRTALASPADLYVINRENVAWLCQESVWPFRGRRVGVIIDELSSFRNQQSKRWRALRKRVKGCSVVWALTGTPAPKGYIDLWPQIYLLDQGARLGATVGAFRARYFDPGARNGHFVYEWRLKPEGKREIDAALADLCVSMRKEDWLTLPPVTHNRVTVRMDRDEREAYDQLERDKILCQLDGADLDEAIVGATAAALRGKLLQLSGGAVYDENGEVVVIHQRKLDALGELEEAAQGQSLLVFYAYRHEAQRILERFPQAVLMGRGEGRDTQQVIQRWNRGEIPMLLCHPASAGHGLNLQAGGHHIVWFSPIDDLEIYQQANARLHRMGQEQPVIIHHILCEDTLDDGVLAALERKDQVQQGLIEALKAYVREGKRL